MGARPNYSRNTKLYLADINILSCRAMNWDIEAPNVVTEARFRELVETGYSAEILCQESAHKKGPSYYGVWIMRAVSDAGVEKLLVTARTRTTHNDIKIREFKTITGVVSFLIGGQGSAADDLEVFTEQNTTPENTQVAALSRSALLPRADVLAAIEATALRYGSHPGLRRALVPLALDS